MDAETVRERAKIRGKNAIHKIMCLNQTKQLEQEAEAERKKAAFGRI